MTLIEKINALFGQVGLADNSRCSDGNCILRDQSKAQGMHTNGGCHCLDGLPTEKRLAVKRKILAANHSTEIATALKDAIEVIRFYADGTNFEAVDNGRNFNVELEVEEYNSQTVSGDTMGCAARAFLEKHGLNRPDLSTREKMVDAIKSLDGKAARNSEEV